MRKHYKHYLSAWLLVVLGGYWGASLGFDVVDPTTLKAVSMLHATLIIGLGYLLCPMWQYRPRRSTLLWWCLLLALAVLIMPWIDGARGLSMATTLKTATAVFLLSLSMHSLTLALSRLFPGNCWIHLHGLSVMVLFSTLPIWMAPWVESIAATPPQLHIVLWSSPLSYLATMLDYDYLRQQWFYRHLPYGMLRYDYPDAIYYSIGLIAASFLMLGNTASKPVEAKSQSKRFSKPTE